MKTLKKINAFRRKLTKLLTKNIGNTQIYENYDLVNKEDIKRILICRPNHRLGNQLLITPIVQELIEIFPNSKIDLFVKGNMTVRNSYQESNILKMHFASLREIGLAKAQRR